MDSVTHRKKQVAKAQAKRRQKLKEKGRVQVSHFLSTLSLAYLESLASSAKVDRSALLERVLREHATQKGGTGGHREKLPSVLSVLHFEENDDTVDSTFTLSRKAIARLARMEELSDEPADEIVQRLILEGSLEGSKAGELLDEALHLFGLYFRRVADGGVVTFEELRAELPKYLDLANERMYG